MHTLASTLWQSQHWTQITEKKK